MALPTITCDNLNGSNTAASGAGPATAVTGTASAHTNGAATTTITLTNSPDLSGVAVDGSAVIHLITSSGRRFSMITAVDNIAKTVTVEDSFTIALASPVDYAIGGKLASPFVTQLSLDVKSGWTVDSLDTGVAYTGFSLNLSNVAANGAYWTCSNGQAIWERTLTTNVSYLCILDTYHKFSNLHFKSVGSGGNYVVGIFSTAISANGHRSVFINCVFETTGTATGGSSGAISMTANSATTGAVILNCRFIGGRRGVYRTSGVATRGLVVQGCVFTGQTTAGVSIGVELNGINITGNVFTSNAIGIQLAAVVTGDICNNTIHGNTGDGISFTASPVGVAILNNQITGNGGYGINSTVSQTFIISTIDHNNFGTGGTANTSGNTHANITTALGNDNLNVDPGYTNAAGLDFSIGVNTKAAGFPDSAEYIGAGQSTTYSYVDIGAAQREEPAGGGLLRTNMRGGMI